MPTWIAKVDPRTRMVFLCRVKEEEKVHGVELVGCGSIACRPTSRLGFWGRLHCCSLVGALPPPPLLLLLLLT